MISRRIRRSAGYGRRIRGAAVLLALFFTLHSVPSLAMDPSSLLDKSLKALRLSGGTVVPQDVAAEPIVFIYNDAIRVKWQKGMAEGSFIGIEGNYDFGAPYGSSAYGPDPEQGGRVTFDVKAALGLVLTEKSRVYFYTGASNAGLHISENHYQRAADFYFGIGFEINVTEEMKLRAEYNLTNYGNNWLRDGFTEINRGQEGDQTFLTRMLWLF
ncbi:hypothetical protein [Paremcibacter congregatus]|uniref:hypothetical protein n=1 Tax=Paremcibacter congregatus TaxID=2043170 RepID=UPI0030EB32D2